MRTTSAAVLFLAGLCPRSGTADAADRPRRPAPTVSAAMLLTEIRTVLTFDDQVLKVAAELGLDSAPQVVYAPQATRLPFPVDRSKVAFVYPGYNAIVLSDRAIGRRDWQLRCVARHEGLHIRLGHMRGLRRGGH
jgi:hypothetical protein